MRAIVVGAGVSGLSCAIELAKVAEVTVAYDRPPEQTTSAIATAIWHLYLVDANNSNVLRWGQRTLERLLELVGEPNTGVSLVRGVELFRTSDLSLPSWADIAIGFELLRPEELTCDFPGTKWGYRLAVPAVNMAKYLPWLVDQCNKLGVHFDKRTVESWHELDYYDHIINCTGLRARALTGDRELFGLRGQYMVLDPPATWTGADYIGDDEHPGGMAYMIPRDGEIMVGGTEEETEELEFNVSEDDLLQRATEFCPDALVGADIARRVVGIRPCRRSGIVVLGRDPQHAKIIHNYGHGGSGVSLSWGCAEAVLSLLHDIVL